MGKVTLAGAAAAEQPKLAELGIRIIRADGTVEEIGIAAASHRSVIRRILHAIFVAPVVWFRIQRANARTAKRIAKQTAKGAS